MGADTRAEGGERDGAVFVLHELVDGVVCSCGGIGGDG